MSLAYEEMLGRGTDTRAALAVSAGTVARATVAAMAAAASAAALVRRRARLWWVGAAMGHSNLLECLSSAVGRA